MPFTTLEDEARTIAAGSLGVAEPQAIKLSKIQVPYWWCDIETQTTVSAQRGLIKDVHAQTLALDWEEVNEQVNLNIEAYLVPAFNAAQQSKGKVTDVLNWHWDCANSESMHQLDLTTTLVPLEVTIDAAFTSLCNYLQHQISAEASAVIGGQQQKNIATDTRYNKVTIRSILLPHWCAAVVQGNETASMLINGQTGATKFPQQSAKSALTDEGNLSMNIKNTTSASSEKSPILVSIYGGAGIGLMVGLLMRLAAPQGSDAKSVVAVFIGAVGVGLAAFLGLNDRNFSTAKGLRIGSFGIAVAISGLAGIYVRDNSLLSPSMTQRATEIRAIFPAISEVKLLTLLSTAAKTTTDADGKTATVAGQLKDLRSAMFSSGGVDRSVCSKLSMSNEDEAQASGVLKNFRYRDSQGTLGWKNLADEVEKNKQLSEKEQKALLFIARDATCGFIKGAKPIIPESQQCQSLKSEKGSADNFRTVFASDPDLSQILTLIDTQTSTQHRDFALKLLGPVLCSDTIQKEK